MYAYSEEFLKQESFEEVNINASKLFVQYNMQKILCGVAAQDLNCSSRVSVGRKACQR